MEIGIAMNERRTCAYLLSVLALLQFAPAVAQEQPDLREGVIVCRSVAQPERRLACYDALPAGAHDEAPVTIDRRSVEALEREGFGFNFPSLAGLLPSLGGERLSHVELTIDRVIDRGDGAHVFLMTNGQRWRQIEALSATNVRTGDVVQVRRGALGSFVLVSPRGGAPHRVLREN